MRAKIRAEKRAKKTAVRLLLISGLVGLSASACSTGTAAGPPSVPDGQTTEAAVESTVPAATGPATKSAAPSAAEPTAQSALVPTAKGATPSATAESSPSPKSKPPLPSLRGDTRNAFAYAPLSNPKKITVSGSVSTSRAWSTSKVLVVLAFIDKVAGGDPGRLSSHWRYQIKQALTASDMDALLQIRGAIPAGSGTPMTRILRSIGDQSTTAPNSREGSMQWSVRNQIRFMAALHSGKLVSKKASKYVLATMHPIAEHQWGLGAIGASSFKGGWLYPDTETRQMGIVGDYAVVIITNGVGPAVYQTDGDYAHVSQMNKLARMLKKHLDAASKQP